MSRIQNIDLYNITWKNVNDTIVLMYNYLNNRHKNSWSEEWGKEPKEFQEWIIDFNLDTRKLKDRLDAWQKVNSKIMAQMKEEGALRNLEGYQEIAQALNKLNGIIVHINLLPDKVTPDYMAEKFNMSRIQNIDLYNITLKNVNDTIGLMYNYLNNRHKNSWSEEWGKKPKEFQGWLDDFNLDTKKLKDRLDAWQKDNSKIMAQMQMKMKMKKGGVLSNLKDYEEKALNELDRIIVDINLLPDKVTPDYTAERFTEILVHKSLASPGAYANDMRLIAIGGKKCRPGPKDVSGNARHRHVDDVANQNLIFLPGNPVKFLGVVNFHMDKNMTKDQQTEAGKIHKLQDAKDDEFVVYEIGTKSTVRQQMVQQSIDIDLPTTSDDSSFKAINHGIDLLQNSVRKLKAEKRALAACHAKEVAALQAEITRLRGGASSIKRPARIVSGRRNAPPSGPATNRVVSSRRNLPPSDSDVMWV